MYHASVLRRSVPFCLEKQAAYRWETWRVLSPKDTREVATRHVLYTLILFFSMRFCGQDGVHTTGLFYLASSISACASCCVKFMKYDSNAARLWLTGFVITRADAEPFSMWGLKLIFPKWRNFRSTQPR